MDDLNALRERRKRFGKRRKPVNISAAAEVCLELDQPASEENPLLLHLLKTCSTYSKIRRTLAYVGRFIHNAWKMNPESGPISVQELNTAETHFLKFFTKFNREGVPPSDATVGEGSLVGSRFVMWNN